VQLIERQKSTNTNNIFINSIMNTSVIPAKVQTHQNIVEISKNAIGQLSDIGITKFLEPVIRVGYPMDYNKLYITTNPEKVLVTNIISRINIDTEFENDILISAENWYDSAIFDIYIPKSELYNIGRTYKSLTGMDVIEITLCNNSVFAYYLINKQSLVVGNWLHDKEYIDVIVKKVWPTLVERLNLKESKN
jgi:hypothetical protein